MANKNGVASVRLSTDLEEALSRASDVTSETQSEFIRVAIQERIERVITPNNRAKLAHMIGAVRTDGGSDARHSGKAFKDLLVAKSKAS